MQDILWLTEWVLAMSTWICHMATKRKEWSRRVLCVGNQNKAVKAYSCMELTKSLWQSKVSIFIKNICVTQWKWLSLTEGPMKRFFLLLFFSLKDASSLSESCARTNAESGCSVPDCCCFWLLSIKAKLASMTRWMVCFNRQGQLQRKD